MKKRGEKQRGYNKNQFGSIIESIHKGGLGVAVDREYEFDDYKSDSG